ncbi:MAG: ATP-dependent zinc metalloprotease FtsH [Ktedonobacteraceae bacterium]
MDDKGGRRFKLVEQRRRLKGVRNYRRNVPKFLKTHKHSFFTGFLLIAASVLLFGLVSQLQPPVMSSIPNGVTVINYSTFVGQVKTGNVLAVTVQGNGVNVLLTKPLVQNKVAQTTLASKSTASQNAADITAWNRYVSAGYPSWPNTTSSPAIDPAREVYTLLPAGGDASLSQLLTSNHVTLNTLPPAQPSFLLGLLWRFMPILLLVLLMALVLMPRNRKNSVRSVDDRVSQIGKSRARRFERVKESVKPRNASGNALSKSSKPTAVAAITAASAQPRVSLDPPVTFADVAGIDEVRVELEEIVQFLRSPERFGRLGARIPRGAMLVGPPGTGKTLLAKAVAGEAGVPFFSMSASEFVEMYVGVGASRVRDLFNQARQAAPCVIFIDELDAVGRKRSMRISGNDERDQTLNQLLVELDGFDSRKAVVVLAATNRVDILDKALLRPGRFDRHINVSLPDRVGREAILKVHTRRTPMHDEVSLERLARLTTGMSGADLANLVNEAALSAARLDLPHVTHDCFEDALARVQLGALRPLIMGEKDRRIIAYHEGGHALVAYHLPQADTVNRVTILPRGQSLGVTQFTSEEDRYNYSRDTLMARIAVGLGGRAAEELTFGPAQITTGAENDLQVVTDLARRMVTRWGMSEQVGVVFTDYEPGAMSLNMQRLDPQDVSLQTSMQSRSLVVDEDGNLMLNGSELPPTRMAFAMSAASARSSSTSMAAVIDSEVQRILKEGYAMARTILNDHNEQLMSLADALMEHEQLDRKQFEALLQEE